MKNKMSQQKIETLQELVIRRLDELGISTYAVARRSNNLISQSVVSRIKNGKTKDPTSDKLKGLALGLGLPLQVVIDAFNQATSNLSRVTNERFLNMSQLFDSMSEKKKERAKPIIEMVERELLWMSNSKD